MHQELREDELLLKRRRLYVQTQVIPTFSNTGCAFMFDSRFSGFIINKDLTKPSTQDLLIDENQYAMPIVVLYDIKKHSQYINKKVHVKGTVIEVPGYIADSLNITYDNDISNICSNFYRPNNENINMICLSLLDDTSKIQFDSNLEQNFEELSIPLFVEAKLDSLNIVDDKVVK